MKLDHFFILTEPPASQAALLSEIGLIEGAPNVHPGQGTSNRRFFLSNTFLELLYVRDPREAEQGPGSRLRLAQRASDPGASPFGLILSGGTDPAVPFPGWRYQPDYLGPERGFLVGDNSDLLAEPLCIYTPFESPPRVAALRPAEPFTTLTELRVHLPVLQPSPVLEEIGKLEQISLRTDTKHLLEVIFNDHAEHRFCDLRPALPMIVRW